MKADNRLRFRRIRGALVRWYNRRRRDLPWRRTSDPYAIWISEIMLQQTQVATVIPYYERFLKRFPNAASLAAAGEQTVLKLWEGLGYYSRARNMRRAAKIIVKDFAGELPASPAELRGLPGIGRYTAGAIASIAFGLDEPVLDGNVTRVLCRVFRVRGNPKQARTEKRLWQLAGDLLPRGKAGLFNQALMDLGATICVPRKPLCPTCPLRHTCEAHPRGEQEKLPMKVKRRPVPHYEIAAGVIRHNGRILIARRKPEGLLGGLWEFPGGKREQGETLEECVVREAREEVQVNVCVTRPLTVVRHAYSHFRITLHAFECQYLSGRPRAVNCAAWRWVAPGQLDRFPFPTANRKIFDALLRRRHATGRTRDA